MEGTHQPEVTVGLPIYNAEKYIAEAIASITQQSFQDWNLLIIDDGSSDRSLAVARSFGEPRITVVAGERNMGLPFRLNQIAREATGRFLARMDADDVMHPERLEKQVAYLQNHPEVDVLGTGVITIDADGRPYGRRSARPPVGAADVLRSGAFIHPTVTGRTEWFRRNPYDVHNDRAEDFDLWVRTHAASTFAWLDEPLLFYRELGLPYLNKYVRSARAVRRVLWQQGPPLVGRAATLKLVASSLAKQAAFTLASRRGREDDLIRRRSVPLTPAETVEAASLIHRATRPPEGT